jgi:alanine racemase
VQASLAAGGGYADDGGASASHAHGAWLAEGNDAYAAASEMAAAGAGGGMSYSAGAAVKILALVKANAYGLGLCDVARFLERQGVDYLGAAFADEGMALRRAGITLPIICLNPEPSSYAQMIEYRLEPEIYSMQSLHCFAAAARAAGEVDYPIHIKLDTGMHRLGFLQSQSDALVRALCSAKPVLRTASIFSHLAAADEACRDAFTLGQLSLFRTWANALRAALADSSIMLHLANSYGTLRFAASHMDMVRAGAALYGIVDNAAWLPSGQASVQGACSNAAPALNTAADSMPDAAIDNGNISHHQPFAAGANMPHTHAVQGACSNAAPALNTAADSMPDAAAAAVNICLHEVLYPLNMRLEYKHGLRGCAIINDAYSADVGSLPSALGMLTASTEHTARAAIIGDLEAQRHYEQAAAMLMEYGIGLLVGIGRGMKAHAHLFGAQAVFYDDAQEFLLKHDLSVFKDMAILVKGSRSSALERIVERLEAHTHITALEVNLTAMADNLAVIRSAIALDGGQTAAHAAIISGMRHVCTLKSAIVQIKHIPAGDSVGYGCRFVAQRPVVVGIVPLGYADGLDRRLGNGAWSVMVNGMSAFIVGSLCMDICMIDLTDVPASEGDSVVFFGAYPSVHAMAARLDTIPYEVLTSISPRVKRIYCYE